ncbi:MAG: hypothetical protein JW841_00455 [Deltaproteobacteria bacterium]|nr:hypothetical protein [Deltaproteobacteria bacterium]
MKAKNDITSFERWPMHFWHDPIHDVVTMTFNNCVISSSDDAIEFMKVMTIHMQRHKTPADVLIDYSGLVVKASAASKFGSERAEFGRRFFQRSYRYNVENASSRSVLYTSKVIYGAETNICATREEALNALLEQRKNEHLYAQKKRSDLCETIS